MKNIILIMHIIVSVSLIALVLLQSSKGGLSSFGGGELYRTKRGAEKIVFMLTIIFACLFLATSIANILIR
ncbi:preprotein translocase subunit SecG [Candidatus Gottesmanbacteria bacterium]|nr:preprotein translocase subunit SecG [Candidatus Gottesmanbacteria bacterium]